METVVVLIMLMVAMSFLLKLTFMRWLPIVAEAGVLALTAVVSTEYAAMQSKTQIAEWLQTPSLMLDTAVLLTIDVALQLAFCIVSVAGTDSLKARILKGCLLYMPGLLIFPATYYLLVQLMFAFTGTDFDSVGYGLAMVILLSVPMIVAGVKWLVPERPVRLELIFYLNCIVALLGIIATVNGRTATVGMNEVNLPALAAMAGLLFFGAIVGLFLYKRKNLR